MPEQTPRQNDLLGADYHNLVDFLEERFLQIKEGQDVARIIILEAESGSGKSRLIREFYRRLIANDDLQKTNAEGEGYWPDVHQWIRSSDVDTDLELRKLVGPPLKDFLQPLNTLPGFYWSSVRCDKVDADGGGSAIDQLTRSFGLHVRNLAVAWGESEDWFTRVKNGLRENPKEKLKTIVTNSGLEAISLGLKAIGFSLPGIDFVTNRAWQLYKKQRTARQEKDFASKGGVLVDNLQSTERRREELTRFTTENIPMVIAAEDIHLMDLDLADLLAALAMPIGKQPVMIIGTSWPEATTRGRVFHDWLEDLAQQDVKRVQVIGSGTTPNFPHLASSELMTLISRIEPELDDETCERLVQRWQNPYALQLVVGSKRIQRLLEGGGGPISRGELERIPQTLKRIYQMRWDELPGGIQEALMLAAASLPPSAKDAAELWPFVGSVVASAAQRIDWEGTHLDLAQVTELLKSSADPYAWTTSDDEEIDTYQFREIDLEHIALEAAEDEAEWGDFQLAVTAEIADQLIERNGDEVFVSDSDELGVLLCRWFLAMPGCEGYPTPRALSSVSLAQEAASRFRWVEVLKLLPEDPALLIGERLDLDIARDIRAATIRGEALTRLGRSSESIDLHKRLVESLTILHGPSHPTSLEARNRMLVSFVESGKLDEALEEFRILLDEYLRVFGSDDPRTLVVRHNIASTLDDLGQVAEALEQNHRVLQDRIRILGPNHQEALGSRSAIAIALQGLGRLDEALEQLLLLLEDSTRALGPDHPHTMDIRGNIANTLAGLRRNEEAFEQQEELLRDFVRVLGPDNPHTLALRDNIAQTLSELGRLDEALEKHQLVLRDQIRVLGSEHPSVIATRTNITNTLRQLGRLGEALQDIRELLHDSIVVLGPNHPHTLTVRNNLAITLREMGDLSESLEEHQSLLYDATRILGPDHPQTFAFRNNLAYTLQALGRLEEALEQHQQLFDDKVRVLGPNHPDTLDSREVIIVTTLGARLSIAINLGELGRLDESLEHSRSLVLDCVALLGSDHFYTMSARSNLAITLRELGRLEEALAENQCILEIQNKLFEADDPEVQETLAEISELLQLLQSKEH
jgi:tetratricopeptide (TPR) repeat protein